MNYMDRKLRYLFELFSSYEIDKLNKYTKPGIVMRKYNSWENVLYNYRGKVKVAFGENIPIFVLFKEDGVPVYVTEYYMNSYTSNPDDKDLFRVDVYYTLSQYLQYMFNNVIDDCGAIEVLFIIGFYIITNST